MARQVHSLANMAAKLHIFDLHLETANRWMKELLQDLELPPDDSDRALHAIRAGLHAIRDRLPDDEGVAARRAIADDHPRRVLRRLDPPSRSGATPRSRSDDQPGQGRARSRPPPRSRRCVARGHPPARRARLEGPDPARARDVAEVDRRALARAHRAVARALAAAARTGCDRASPQRVHAFSLTAQVLIVPRAHRVRLPAPALDVDHDCLARCSR